MVGWAFKEMKVALRKTQVIILEIESRKYTGLYSGPEATREKKQSLGRILVELMAMKGIQNLQKNIILLTPTNARK